MHGSHQSSSSSRQTCQFPLPLSTPSAVQRADSGCRIPICFSPPDDRCSAAGRRNDDVRVVDGDETSFDGGLTRPVARVSLADGQYERRRQLERVGEVAVDLRHPRAAGVDARRPEHMKSRPVSEVMHPTACFPKGSSHGCKQDGLGGGELRLESRGMPSTTNDSYHLPVSGYVVVGRGPHTMTAVAAAANGRHPPSTTATPATVGDSALSGRDTTARNYDSAAFVLPSGNHVQKQQQQPDHRPVADSTGSWHCNQAAAAASTDGYRPGPHLNRDSASACQSMPPLKPTRTPDNFAGGEDGALTAVLDDRNSRLNAQCGVGHCSRSIGASLPSSSSRETASSAVGLRDNRSDLAVGGRSNDANRQRDLNNRSGPSRDFGPILTTSTVFGRPTSCAVNGRNFSETSNAAGNAAQVPPPRPDLPTFVTGWQVLPNGKCSSGGGSTISVPVRHWSYSDDSGFSDERTTTVGETAAVKMAPSLEAHSACLSYSPPSHVAATSVDLAPVNVGGLRRGPLTASSASSSSSASSGSGLQIRRRLKTIVESLDGFASGSNRKSVFSVATNGSSDTRKTSLKMQRSTSEPEGLDRIGKSAEDDADDEFGFRCDAGHHQVRVLRDGCQLSRCTGNKLPPTPAATTTNGVDFSGYLNGDATPNKTSSGSKSTKTTMSIKMMWPTKKAAPPRGGDRHSEPSSPLNSSATSRPVSERGFRLFVDSKPKTVEMLHVAGL
jgi:hypothetical protein